MKISPVRYGFSYNAKAKNPSFGSICADCTTDKMENYILEAVLNPDFAKLKASQTRIMRELPCELAIPKLINKKGKTNIRILGASDGSEAFGYAVATKENLGFRARNVKITGVEINPVLVELAKTGKIVCSETERILANQAEKAGEGKSPLAGKGFDKYLTKTKRPDNFDELRQKAPYIRYMEYDPVVNKGVDRGLDWYKVNKNGLSEISFKTGDMKDNLDFDEKFDTEVYVIANSGGYVIQKSSKEFLDMFEKIKQNKDMAEKHTGKKKTAYVVIGNLEFKVLNDKNSARYVNMTPPEQEIYREEILNKGFEIVNSKELASKGVSNPDRVQGKIYRAI